MIVINPLGKRPFKHNKKRNEMFPYMGGKAHHIKHLGNLFPTNTNTFVDVFGGAGWVSVKNNTQAKHRIYNDLNPHLANIFKHFSTDPTAVRDQINSWPQQDAVLYRQFQQDIFGPCKPTLNLETAAKYLYLEVQSFSGNTLGLTSSVYFDKIHTINPLLKKLANEKICDRLQQLTVENLDCVEVIKKYDGPDTFFYIDPPYWTKEHYYTQAFGREQHKELADCLRVIQGKFALSYYHFDELDEWFPEPKFNKSIYTISKQSSSRTNKQRGIELVIRNYSKEEIFE
jgi:DNA adenine methylase